MKEQTQISPDVIQTIRDTTEKLFAEHGGNFSPVRANGDLTNAYCYRLYLEWDGEVYCYPLPYVDYRSTIRLMRHADGEIDYIKLGVFECLPRLSQRDLEWLIDKLVALRTRWQEFLAAHKVDSDDLRAYHLSNSCDHIVEEIADDLRREGCEQFCHYVTWQWEDDNEEDSD